MSDNHASKMHGNKLASIAHNCVDNPFLTQKEALDRLNLSDPLLDHPLGSSWLGPVEVAALSILAITVIAAIVFLLTR